MVAAIGTLLLIVSTAQAKPPQRFGRFRASERDRIDLTSSNLRQHRSAKISRPARPVPVPPEYPRYRLVDLGTLGGPNSGVWGFWAPLNNRGEVIAQLGTPFPDPYDPNCLNFDCFVWHGGVREINGVITNLGALPGVNSSAPIWITDNGLIAGLSENGLIDPLTDFPQLRAVLWNQDRSIVDLGTLGGNSSMGLAANSRSQVVGVALNAIEENPDFAQVMMFFLPAATQARAFRWQNGFMQDLGTLGGNDAAAWGVNQSGQIVGFSFTNTTPNETTGIPTLHPFLWTNGTMQDLGSLGGTLSISGSLDHFGSTRAVNESGEVAGTSTLAGDEVWHAFMWSNGTMIDLGTLGGSTSDALAINNKSQVVGRADFSPDSPYHHAVVWCNGSIQDLGIVDPCKNSTATSVNSANQIVGGLGVCTDDPSDPTYFSGFYTEKGKTMVDLNTLITPASEIHLTDAWTINNRGEILANGKLPDGSERVALLVPVPGR